MPDEIQRALDERRNDPEFQERLKRILAEDKDTLDMLADGDLHGEVRLALIDAGAAIHRLQSLVGPLWHEREALRAEVEKAAESHCDWCSVDTRGLFAVAFNAANAVEAAMGGAGEWARARRKLRELREELTRLQPALDAHFEAHR